MNRAAKLKPTTLAMLGGRRDMRMNGRKDEGGFWRWTNHRIRSVADYDRIERFPRCPPAARKLVERELRILLADARRYTDAG